MREHREMQGISIRLEAKVGRVVARVGGREAGRLSFVVRDARLLDAYETFVAPEYRSMSLAAMLVERLLDYCRGRRLLLQPSCSYVARYVERHEEYADLLESNDRSAEIALALEAMGSAEKREVLMRFFKTAPGQYGYGDHFVGVALPQIRRLMRQERPWSRATIEGLLVHQIHEVRWLGFALLADWMRRATHEADRLYIYRTYIDHRIYCNNWDLVDASAPDIIVGGYWAERDPIERREALFTLATEEHLWTQRIAILGTFGLIRRGMPDDTLAIAEYLLPHSHDLIHKAVGWMLREVGKRIGESLLIDFLDRYASRMPRTALRYAIERLSPEQRKHYMQLR